MKISSLQNGTPQLFFFSISSVDFIGEEICKNLHSYFERMDLLMEVFGRPILDAINSPKTKNQIYQPFYDKHVMCDWTLEIQKCQFSETHE